MRQKKNRMGKFVAGAVSAIAAAMLVFGVAAPAQAAYSVGLAGLTCGSSTAPWLPLPEIHVKSTALGSVDHFTDDAVHGTSNIFAGASASYFTADTHHWLRRNMTYGYVKSSSNYTSSIKSASRYCV